MRLALIALLMICNLANAQVQVTPIYTLGWAVKYFTFHGSVSNKHYQFGAGVDFNRSLAAIVKIGIVDNHYYFNPPKYKYPPHTKHADIYFSFQYRLLSKKSVSPVVEMETGCGFKSKANSGVAYFSEVGTFQRIKSAFGLQLLFDFSHKWISIQVGGGLASQVISLKEEYPDGSSSMFDFRNNGLNASARVILRPQSKKAKNE